MLFGITLYGAFQKGVGQILSPQGPQVLFLKAFEPTEDLAGYLVSGPSPDQFFAKYKMRQRFRLSQQVSICSLKLPLTGPFHNALAKLYLLKGPVFYYKEDAQRRRIC
jgi:hypothetical protein